jgi:hypothetical protein
MILSQIQWTCEKWMQHSFASAKSRWQPIITHVEEYNM